MFGHAPPPVVECLAREGARGLTTMMPSEDAAVVGELLSDRFGLPFWQVTTSASDANRAVLRWCRAITDRKKFLIFNHCYHGRRRRHLCRLPIVARFSSSMTCG